VFKIEKSDIKAIVLAVVVVAALAVLALNPYTGKVVSSSNNVEKATTIRLFSEKPTDLTEEEIPIISKGSKLYVVVETGSQGCRKTADIMKVSTSGRADYKAANINLCDTTSSCVRNRVITADYHTSTSWETGTYYIRVKDDLLSSKNTEGKEVFATASFVVR